MQKNSIVPNKPKFIDSTGKKTAQTVLDALIIQLFNVDFLYIDGQSTA